jgi:hypothetical protein
MEDFLRAENPIVPEAQVASYVGTSHTGVTGKLIAHKNAHAFLCNIVWESAHIIYI